MQLQPSVVSFLRFSSPQYQYQPQSQKTVHLQMFYKSDPDHCFVQLIEHVLSDRYLYEHPGLVQQLAESRKGYVRMQRLLVIQSIKTFLQEMEESTPSVSGMLRLINKLSTKLLCNRTSVRRKSPFVNRIKLSKPLYIEEYPENDGNEELETLLESTCHIYKIKYKHEENWAIVYCQKPDQLYQLNGHFWSIKTYFRVMSYEQSKEIFDMPLNTQINSVLKLFQASWMNKKLEDMRGTKQERYFEELRENADRMLERDEDLEHYRMMREKMTQMDEDQMEEMVRDRKHKERNVERMRNRRNQTTNTNRQSPKQKRRKEFMLPNPTLNSALLTNAFRRTITSPSTPKLSPQHAYQIDNLLMQYFDQATLNLTPPPPPTRINPLINKPYSTLPYNRMDLQ